jgi:hypothetical protein
LKNLKDDGDFLVRVRLFFTKNGSALSGQADGEDPLDLNENDLAPLTDYVYKHLCKCLAEPTWFKQNQSDYKSTGIGFTAAS